MINKYCKACGRECKNQMQEDYELCEYHLGIYLKEDLDNAVSSISNLI